MIKITEKIKQGNILISDGAWGTFLQKKGLKPGECPELWNINKPDEIFDIARSYIDAGADMIETNSFGGNYYKLKLYHLEDKVYEINSAAAALSKKAAGTNRYVLGSVGPSGKILLTGEVTEDELYHSFKVQSEALAEGGADAIIIETMSDIEEAKIAVKAAKENTGCEVICTMTFEKSGANEYFTMMGITPTQMTNELLLAGADIIGANCGNGMEGMIGIVKEIRKVNGLIPVLIHANAGLPFFHNGETVFPENPEQMASFVKPLIEAGTNIIGGCCGTTPEHIRKMAEVVRKFF